MTDEFAPKGQHNPAQGRERSERTLGEQAKKEIDPNGVAQDDFRRAVEYVLKKNEELYRRLA